LKPEDPVREDLIDSLCYGEIRLPGMDEIFDQLLARINLVCVASPELDYPCLDFEGLRKFFRYALAGREEPDQVDVGAALAAFVGQAKMRWLDEIVPRRWRLGDAAGFDLQYSAETNPGEGVALSPIGTVRVSQLGGLRDHPFVCEGRVAVRLRLLNDDDSLLEETLDWSAHSARLISRSSR
jgi:hypothetical protein